MDEAGFLLDIQTAGGSDHIVKLYRSTIHEGGSSTQNDFDPDPFNAAGAYVHNIYRMYMEYCENGDLMTEWESGKGQIRIA
jgi:hypothetical protein